MDNLVKKDILSTIGLFAIVIYFLGFIYNDSGEAYVELNDKLSKAITERHLDRFKDTPIKSIRISSNRDILNVGRVGVYRSDPYEFTLGGKLYGEPSVFYDADDRIFSFIDHRFVDLANIEIADNQIKVHYEPRKLSYYESVLTSLSDVLDTVLDKHNMYQDANKSWN